MSVQDLINDARSYAKATLSGAMYEMEQAMQVLQGLGNTFTGQTMPQIPIIPPKPGDPGTPPAYAGPHFSSPVFDAASPKMLDVPGLDTGGGPGAVPAIAAYTPQVKPTGPAGDPSLIAGAPTVSASDYPVPPAPDMLGEIAGIDKPVIDPIVIPPLPGYTSPEFLGIRPSQPPPAPTDLEGTMRSNFLDGSAIMRSAISDQIDAFLDKEFPNFRAGMAKIEARLDKYLAGGSALAPDIESAMYNRALDKNNAEYVRETRKNYGMAARAGFTLPVVTLMNQQKDIDQVRRDANARTTNEILIKQAELEQNNLQFAVSASSTLRQLAMSSALTYYGGLVTINGQAVEYARSIVDAIVKTYDLAVKYVEIQARVYESEARIFEAKWAGVRAVIDAYTAQVRGLEAQANVDLALVTVYKARIEAVQAEAMVYKAQVEAVAVQAQIARLTVEVYQAKVQAYATQVNARTAEWQGYEAATRGEVAKVQASAEAVKAYVAQAEGYRVLIQARTAAIEAVQRTNESATRVYAVQLEAYRSLVQGQSEAIRAEIASYSETIHAFIAKANAISEHSRSEIAAYEVGLRAVVAEANLFLEQLKETHNMDIHRVEGMAKVSVAAGEIFAATSQASLSGMNSLAVQAIQE